MAKQISFFDGAESSTTPTLGNIDTTSLVGYVDDAAYEAANLGAPQEGNMYFNTTDKVVRVYNDTEWVNVLDEKNTAVVENKTIDGSDATGNNTILTEAYESHYDNTGTGLLAVNVQAAITELDGRLDTAESVNNAQGTDILNLETLSGSPGDSHHGTFTGATIPDNSTTKAALQALETEVELKLDASEKGSPNGVAELDGTGKVPAAQLPSYVDDVLEYADLASFPVTGETGKIYVALDTNFTYRWTGSIYVQISAAGGIDWSDPVTSSIIPDTDNTYDIGQGVSAEFANVFASSLGSSVRPVGIGAGDSNASIELYNFGSGPVAPRLRFIDYNNGNYASIKAPETLAADYTLTLPPDDGAANQFLKTDGSGLLSWDFASGGGSQGLIQDDNSNLENSIGSWVSYADAAGIAPVDGTGGSPGIVLSRTSVSGDILEGGFSLKIEKGAVNRQGEGVSLTIPVDKGYRGKACKLSFLYEASSGFNFGNPNDFIANPSDILIYAYDVTNSVLLNTNVPGVHGDKFYESLIQIPSSCESLRVILHIATTSAVAYDFFADRFELDLAKNEFVKASTDAINYGAITLTSSGGGVAKATSPTIDSLRGYFDGQFWIGTYRYSHTSNTGAANGSGDYILAIPTSVGKVDLSQIPIYTTINTHNSELAYRSVIGVGNGYDAGPSTKTFKPILYSDSSFRIISDNLFGSVNFVNSGSSAIASSVYGFTVTVRVPIVGRTSGNEYAENIGLNSNVNFSANTSTTAATTSAPFIFTSVTKDNTGAYNNSTGVYTVKSPGDYLINARVYTNSAMTIRVYINGTSIAQGDAGSTTSASSVQYLAQNLKYGDTIEIRPDTSATATGGSTLNYFQAFKTQAVNNPYAPRIAYLKDIKSSGTAGGTFTSGSYQTRTLNTLEGDGSFVSLSANQFTLQAGTYHFEAEAPAGFVNGHKAKLRNITDSSDTIIGSTEYDSTIDNYTSTRSKVLGQFSITSAKVFEVQHRCETTKATDGFGASQTFGDNNVFTQVKITKVL